MKIAFAGKGGSGKTTLSSLFARHLAGQGLPVVAIDAVAGPGAERLSWNISGCRRPCRHNGLQETDGTSCQDSVSLVMISRRAASCGR